MTTITTIYAAMSPDGPTAFKMPEAYRRIYYPEWPAIVESSQDVELPSLEELLSSIQADGSDLAPSIASNLGWLMARAADFLLEKPLSPILAIFGRAAVLQYADWIRPRIDAWTREGTFNLVVGRFWLEVFAKRG
jgi:hypothetical protein